jgi:hypothetical protein
MSKPATPTYAVTLFQLAPDAKKAGGEFAAAERAAVGEKELRALLLAAAALAPKVTYPLAPEIRITAPSGKFVIRVKDGQLRFVSWSSAKSSVVEPSIDEMLAIIRGELVEGGIRGDTRAQEPGEKSILKGWMRIAAIYLLVFVVVGLNVLTIMRDKRPPRSFLPEFRLIEPEPASRVLASVAGNYETGRTAGSRRLQINRDGTVRWIKFGPERSVAEEKTLKVRAAESNGAKTLLTDRQSMINIKDPSTVVLFGDTYVRVLN